VYAGAVLINSSNGQVVDTKIVRSTDDGQTWTQIGQSSFTGRIPITIAFDKAGSIYVGTNDGLFKSTNLGQDWAAKNQGLMNTNISSLAVNSQGHVFAGTYGGGVHRSTNNADTWVQEVDGMDDLTVRALAIDSHGYLYAGTDNGGGVYRTAYSTTAPALPVALPATNITREMFVAIWNPAANAVSYLLDVSADSLFGTFITGYRNRVVTTNQEIVQGLSADSKYFYRVRASNSSGESGYSNTIAVKTTLTDVVDCIELPLAPVLVQNYPNPFNPATTIRYALPHRSHVTLTVYNTLGQQVAQLINSDIDAGYHEVQFNATNLASGVYFYRIQAGSYVETRKLLYVR